MSKKIAKNSSNHKGKSPQAIEIDKVSENILGVSFGKKILKPRDIKRIHSKLITTFIQGNITSERAKTLSYLCQSYLQALGFIEMEERIKALEEKTGANHV